LTWIRDLQSLGANRRSGSFLTPNFWTDPTSGIPYYLAVQTPQYLADSLNEIKNTPIDSGGEMASTSCITYIVCLWRFRQNRIE
jgi:hypothetical protein